MHPDIPLYPSECIDPILNGRLRIIQSKDGYRFSADALLLARFAPVKQGDLVVELGTGCGVVLLALLALSRPRVGIGLEIQRELADQASRNARLNGFQDQMHPVLGDLRHPPIAGGCADLVLCNPPYRRVEGGRINPDPRRAVARHELMASLDDILRAADWLLRKKGRLSLIYPAVRLVDILVRLRRFNLEPKRLLMNFPGPASSAKLVLIEAIRGGKPGVDVMPPLFGQDITSMSDSSERSPP